MQDFIQKITENIIPWLLNHGIKILAIIIVAQLVRRFSGIFIEKFIRKFVISDHFLSKEWDVAGELRKRLKIAFDKEGIEIPFPQRVIHEAPK